MFHRKFRRNRFGPHFGTAWRFLRRRSRKDKSKGCQRRRRFDPVSLLLSSDTVRLNGKGICQSYRFAVNWGRRLAPRLWGRLVMRSP